MINKEIQAKSRNLLKEYEDLLKYIIEEEEKELAKDNKIGNNQFEIIKDVIFKAGIKEGMRRVLAKLNKYSYGD